MVKIFSFKNIGFSSKNPVSVFPASQFAKFIYRKISGLSVPTQFFKVLVLISLISGMGVGLTSCSSMQEKSWRLHNGMSQEEVIAIMGEPAQRLPDRLMYEVPYYCTKVPYYIYFEDLVSVKRVIPKVVSEAATRDCEREEGRRNIRRAQANKTAEMLGQVQFGTHPTEFSKKMEPLMQNCWMDSAGWHCL
jgi:hypothetical protein